MTTATAPRPAPPAEGTWPAFDAAYPTTAGPTTMINPSNVTAVKGGDTYTTCVETIGGGRFYVMGSVAEVAAALAAWEREQGR